MRAYVGLDVHSKTSFFVARDERGRELGRGEIETSRYGFREMRRRVRLPASTVVALESGTTSFYAARCLSHEAFRPMVIEAGEVRAKARRRGQKSDSRDAEELCEGVRRGIYERVVHVPPEEIQEIRETLSRRRHFVRLQTGEVNAAKRLLRAEGLTGIGRVSSERAWQRLLARVPRESCSTKFLELHRAVWMEAKRQIERLECQLNELGRQRGESFQRLQTLCGVGPIVALTAISTFSDIKRFPSAKHAASYAGLVPRTYHSGEREAFGSITKSGSSELRAMLVQAAHSARYPDHPMHAHMCSLATRVGVRKAVVAVAHRMCRVIYAMLRDGRDFDPARVTPPRFSAPAGRIYVLKPVRSPAKP